MTRVLIVTGDQDTAFDLMDELQHARGDIEVTLICSTTDPYDPTLRGIDAIITDGTTRTEETARNHTLAWFYDPVEAARCRLRPMPIIQIERFGRLLEEDVTKITKTVIDALSRS